MELRLPGNASKFLRNHAPTFIQSAMVHLDCSCAAALRNDGVCSQVLPEASRVLGPVEMGSPFGVDSDRIVSGFLCVYPNVRFHRKRCGIAIRLPPIR